MTQDPGSDYRYLSLVVSVNFMVTVSWPSEITVDLRANQLNATKSTKVSESLFGIRLYIGPPH